MQVNSSKSIWAARVSSGLLAGSLLLLLSCSAAFASPDCTSDKRGTSYPFGSPKSCASIGLRGDTQVGSTSDVSANDVNVAGTVKTNEGAVQPGIGQEVDITISGPSTVVVDAVVVAGGFRHSIYRDAKYLPPTLGPDQHYIPPFNIYGSVPGINYWFTCYHLDPAGALPEVPQALDVPLVGGAIFVAFMLVQRRRRKASSAA